jgi:prepilin-type N-terminal cleavage/methylation domain-containing protein
MLPMRPVCDHESMNGKTMKKHTMNILSFASNRRRQAGFTLLELSVVLVVIGLIMTAVSVGKDVQRNAVYQRISSDFIQGWLIAYDSFVQGAGGVPGDNVAAPTGRVNGALAGAPALCGAALMGAMQAAGITMPAGRAEGSPERFGYLDSNGVPHEVQVCFQSVAWSSPGAAVGTYVAGTRNVMTVTGLTPALATFLDSSIDGRADARFGIFREQANAALTTVDPILWSVDDRMAIGSVVATAQDSDQVAEVAAYLKMNQ